LEAVGKRLSKWYHFDPAQRFDFFRLARLNQILAVSSDASSSSSGSISLQRKTATKTNEQRQDILKSLTNKLMNIYQ
jgi:hypothetical protein